MKNSKRNMVIRINEEAYDYIVENQLGAAWASQWIEREVDKRKSMEEGEVLSVGHFVSEYIEVIDDKTHRMELASLVYERYFNMALRLNIKAIGRNNFYEELQVFGIYKKNSSGNALYLYGGELKEVDRFDDWEDLDDLDDEDWEL